MSVRALFLVLLLLPSIPAFSQVSVPSARVSDMVEMQINLSFSDGSSFTGGDNMAGVAATTRGSGGPPSINRDFTANLQVRVQLQEGTGDPIEERSPNREGRMTFRVRNGSVYRLRIFGPDIEETMVERVEPNRGDRYMNITIRRRASANVVTTAAAATVPAIRLQIPPNAQKEFDKGAEAQADGDLKKARRQYEKAIELYPQFDQAYNNLGVVFMETDEPEKGRQAFEKAIALNDSFSRAYVNLAKIELGSKNFVRANQLLQKSLVGDPLNAQALYLGAQAAVFAGDADTTIANTQKLHTMPHPESAAAHYLAGRAHEMKKQPAEAIKEYELFLKEAPENPNGPAARRQIKELKKVVSAAN